MRTTASIWASGCSSRMYRRSGDGESGGGLRATPGASVFKGALLMLIGLVLASGLARANEEAPSPQETVYQDTRVFVEQAFDGVSPEPSVLWLDAERKGRLKGILGHRYGGLRVRYWRQDETTAWILEEIGKYYPITAGFVVEQGRIANVEVLVYRESHGWEIRYPFFTDQFRGLALDEETELSGTIDNISGATLSVNSMERLARAALYLHGEAIDGGS